MSQTLHSFCREYDLPKTSVRRWLNDQGFNTSDGLSEEAIKSALDRFKPAKPIVEQVDEEVAETSIVRTESVANPLMPIQIGELHVHVQTANTRQLAEETTEFQNVTAQGLHALGQYLQADLISTVQSTVAQNRHAVAGLNAAAVVNLANNMGKPADSGSASSQPESQSESEPES